MLRSIHNESVLHTKVTIRATIEIDWSVQRATKARAHFETIYKSKYYVSRIQPEQDLHSFKNAL